MTREEWAEALRADPESEVLRLAMSDIAAEILFQPVGQRAIDSLRAGTIPCDQLDGNILGALYRCSFGYRRRDMEFIEAIVKQAKTAPVVNSPLSCLRKVQARPQR